MPSARRISFAADTNWSVMIPSAGTPSLSAAIASCRLHDEQLPQSPTPAIMASQVAASSMIARSAGALRLPLTRCTTFATP